MAVLENGVVTGILDESDILLVVTGDADNFKKPVRDFMTTKLTTLSADSNIDQRMPLFANDMVAIVVDSDIKYLGLITKIDLIWKTGLRWSSIALSKPIERQSVL